MQNIEDIISGSGIFRGVSVNSISKKEKELGKKLPASYKVFLNLMGEYATFLAGDSCFFEDIDDVQIGFRNTFSKYVKQHELTDDDFAFCSSQGTSYCFFNLSQGQDPPVFFYIEGCNLEKPIKLTDSFTDYIVKRYNKDRTLFAKFYDSLEDTSDS